MPKSKEFVDSDDSSASGSSSETEKKGKKRMKKEMKQDESKEGSSVKKSKKDEDEPTWELEDKCRLTFRKFKGKHYIDIRSFYDDPKTGNLMPSKKGISLTPKLWRNLLKIAPEVSEVVDDRC